MPCCSGATKKHWRRRRGRGRPIAALGPATGQDHVPVALPVALLPGVQEPLGASDAVLAVLFLHGLQGKAEAKRLLSKGQCGVRGEADDGSDACSDAYPAEGASERGCTPESYRRLRLSILRSHACRQGRGPLDATSCGQVGAIGRAFISMEAAVVVASHSGRVASLCSRVGPRRRSTSGELAGLGWMRNQIISPQSFPLLSSTESFVSS